MSDENIDNNEAPPENTVLTGDTENSDTSVNDGSTDVKAESGDNTSSESNDETTGESSQTPPDTYADFSLPEGITLDEGLLSEAQPIFKELGLTQEQAQKLVDFQAKQVQASSQSQVDAFNQLMEDWKGQAKNDSEFGGDKFEENVALARSAIEKFGTTELKQLLDEHGVGNHPEMIRFMVKVGSLTKEDNPGNNSVPVKRESDRVNQLYPNDRNTA